MKNRSKRLVKNLPKRNRLKREKRERIPPIEEIEDMLRLALARMTASLLASLPACETRNPRASL